VFTSDGDPADDPLAVIVRKACQQRLEQGGVQVHLASFDGFRRRPSARELNAKPMMLSAQRWTDARACRFEILAEGANPLRTPFWPCVAAWLHEGS
jgi:hypothetical protein